MRTGRSPSLSMRSVHALSGDGARIHSRTGGAGNVAADALGFGAADDFWGPGAPWVAPAAGCAAGEPALFTGAGAAFAEPLFGAAVVVGGCAPGVFGAC